MKIKYVLLFLLGIIVGFNFPHKSALIPVTTKLTEKETEAQFELPECDLGKCPEYESVDVDGDTLSESVVYIPYLMTKNVGNAWIIKDGKAVFKSPWGPGFTYEINKDNNGITISYISDYQENKINPKERTYEKYVFENGQYDLKDTTTDDLKCLKHFDNPQEVEWTGKVKEIMRNSDFFAIERTPKNEEYPLFLANNQFGDKLGIEEQIYIDAVVKVKGKLIGITDRYKMTVFNTCVPEVAIDSITKIQ